MKKLTFVCIMLCGCSYRYDLGRFEPMIVKQPQPESEMSVVRPCEEVDVKTTSLQVTTKLDETNQVVTTNAVTETHEIPSKPCQ